MSSTVLAGTKSAGDACALPTECASTCCDCGTGSASWLAASCVSGTCVDSLTSAIAREVDIVAAVASSSRRRPQRSAATVLERRRVTSASTRTAVTRSSRATRTRRAARS